MKNILVGLAMIAMSLCACAVCILLVLALVVSFISLIAGEFDQLHPVIWIADALILLGAAYSIGESVQAQQAKKDAP